MNRNGLLLLVGVLAVVVVVLGYYFVITHALMRPSLAVDFLLM